MGLGVVLQYLKEISMPITTEQEISNVCQVSSNYNEVISQIVAKTLATVGLDGVINMTESATGFSRFALVNGLVLERGMVSQLFAESDQTNKDSPASDLFCELEQPLVLVVADRIT